MKRKDISDIEVCKAYLKYQEEKKDFPYEILANKFGCDNKLAYRACERAASFPNNFVEFGVSLRTGWLTEKGKSLLNSMPNSSKEEKTCNTCVDYRGNPPPHVCLDAVVEEEKCDGECHFQYPYGFVPHAGCPLHDKMTEEERKQYSVPTWEEKEREIWMKSDMASHIFDKAMETGATRFIARDYISDIADCWIDRMKAVREEAYDEGAAEATMVCNEKTIPLAINKARSDALEQAKIEIFSQYGVTIDSLDVMLQNSYLSKMKVLDILEALKTKK